MFISHSILFRSKFRHLSFSKDRLFVVDSGQNKVYIIPNEDDASLLSLHGDREHQGSGPSEMAFDDQGNLIIVDSKNNRLQCVDINQNAYPVKVRTSRIFSHFSVNSYFRSTML